MHPAGTEALVCGSDGTAIVMEELKSGVAYGVDGWLVREVVDM